MAPRTGATRRGVNLGPPFAPERHNALDCLPAMNRIVAIIPAAGLGTRMGADKPKQFLELDGVSLVVFALRRLAACPSVTEFIVATRPEEIGILQEQIARAKLERRCAPGPLPAGRRCRCCASVPGQNALDGTVAHACWAVQGAASCCSPWL